MAFKGFDKAVIEKDFPKITGRGSGKPTVTIAGNGRISFSSDVSKAFEGCKVVAPMQEGNKIAFVGHKVIDEKLAKTFTIELVHPKPSKKDNKIHSKNVALPGTTILKALKYDYTAAGNQSYEAEKVLLDKNTVVFTLPETLPAKKASKSRKVKEAKTPTPINAAAGAPANATNGTPAAPPVADPDEMVLEQ